MSKALQVRPWTIGLLGFGFAAGLALRLLVPNGLDPTVFVAFGDESPVQTPYGQRLLGTVATRPGGGHDGQSFFIQANDPWYLEPKENAALLDRPLYRAQRMLYPMVAGGLGLFPPNLIVWAMLITNVLALGIGASLAASLAVRMGGPAWLGLWVPLNVGLLFELDIGGSGILAYVCCLGALSALSADRVWLAGVLFAAAALSREAMLAFAVGVFLLDRIERRQPRWPIVMVPAVALTTWDAYIWIRLRGISGAGGGIDSLGPPLLGLVEGARSWLEEPLTLVTSLVVVAVVVAFVPLALRSRSSIAWGALPFVVLATVLSANVWAQPFNSSRALAPILTAFPLLILSSEHAPIPSPSSSEDGE